MFIQNYGISVWWGSEIHGIVGLNTIGAAPCCVVTLMKIYAPLRKSYSLISVIDYCQKLKLIDSKCVSITVSNGFGVSEFWVWSIACK